MRPTPRDPRNNTNTNYSFRANAAQGSPSRAHRPSTPPRASPSPPIIITSPHGSPRASARSDNRGERVPAVKKREPGELTDEEPLKRHKGVPQPAADNLLHRDPGARKLGVHGNHVRFRAFVSVETMPATATETAMETTSETTFDMLAVAYLLGGVYRHAVIGAQTYRILYETDRGYENTEEYLAELALTKNESPENFVINMPNLGVFVPLYQPCLSESMREVYTALDIKTATAWDYKGVAWTLAAGNLKVAQEALREHLKHGKATAAYSEEEYHVAGKQACAWVKEYYTEKPSPILCELVRLLGGSFVTVLAKGDRKCWVLVPGETGVVTYTALAKAGAIEAL
jgi:hypothetical protein